MGLARVGDRIQGKPGPGATAEDWIEHGYNPRRRSVMWNVGDALIKGNGADGYYRRVYDERKAYEVARAQAAGLQVVPAAKIPAKRKDEFMSEGHVRNHPTGHRLVRDAGYRIDTRKTENARCVYVLVRPAPDPAPNPEPVVPPDRDEWEQLSLEPVSAAEALETKTVPVPHDSPVETARLADIPPPPPPVAPPSLRIVDSPISLHFEPDGRPCIQVGNVIRPLEPSELSYVAATSSFFINLGVGTAR